MAVLQVILLLCVVAAKSAQVDRYASVQWQSGSGWFEEADPNKGSSGTAMPQAPGARVLSLHDRDNVVDKVSIRAGRSSPTLFAASPAFVEVPAGATVTGIRLSVVRWSPGDMRDSMVALRVGGVVRTVSSPCPASATCQWPHTSGVVQTFGGENDLWGLSSDVLTPAAINTLNFGVAITVSNFGTTNHVAYFDWLMISIFYTEASTGTPGTTSSGTSSSGTTSTGTTSSGTTSSGTTSLGTTSSGTTSSGTTSSGTTSSGTASSGTTSTGSTGTTSVSFGTTGAVCAFAQDGQSARALQVVGTPAAGTWRLTACSSTIYLRDATAVESSSDRFSISEPGLNGVAGTVSFSFTNLYITYRDAALDYEVYLSSVNPDPDHATYYWDREAACAGQPVMLRPYLYPNRAIGWAPARNATPCYEYWTNEIGVFADPIEAGADFTLRHTFTFPANIGCFSGSMRAMLASGETRVMAELRLGDVVAAAKFDADGTVRTVYSEIFSFGHYSQSTLSFLNVTLADSTSLVLTDNHQVYRQDAASGRPTVVAAGSLRPGDLVYHVDIGADVGRLVPVASVGFTVQAGIYEPLTVEGSIVVEGIVSDCYGHPQSYIAFLPFRWLHVLGLYRPTEISDIIEEDGVSRVSAFMVRTLTRFRVLEWAEFFGLKAPENPLQPTIPNYMLAKYGHLAGSAVGTCHIPSEVSAVSAQ